MALPAAHGGHGRDAGHMSHLAGQDADEPAPEAGHDGGHPCPFCLVLGKHAIEGAQVPAIRLPRRARPMRVPTGRGGALAGAQYSINPPRGPPTAPL